MNILGVKMPKKFNAPVLKPMAPFLAAGGIMYMAIWSLQSMLMKSPAYANDPRNPAAKSKAAPAGH
jgi:F-type H+-transporting ATPase subunit j